MSFFQDTLLPGSSTLHSGDASSKQRSVRKSRSHAGFLKPLVRLLADPRTALDNYVESISSSSAVAGTSDANRLKEVEEKRQILYVRLNDATTYEAWCSAAIDLDHLEGNDTWKFADESIEYDHELVATRLRQLDEARLSCDVSRMLFLVRTSLTRGLGGMGDLRLYTHSHTGTKDLIERYIDSAERTLEALLDVSEKQRSNGLQPRYVLEQILAARQSFGRSALLLSGGGTFGMNHNGVVKVLWEQRLLPRIISGASAGSIVASVLCTRTDDEIPSTLAEFCYGDLDVFEKGDESEGILKKAARFLKHGAIFDNSHLVNMMRNLLGDLTFQEAYNRTRRILNITVSSASVYELPRLLNYVTAPNVIIWSAVSKEADCRSAASCSVPFVFSATQIMAKDPKTGKEVPWNVSAQHWIDGSVDNDLPMSRLAEMFNVNHFIVSQVNPHVVPFLKKEERIVKADARQEGLALESGSNWLYSVAGLAKGEALYRMQTLAEFGFFPNYMSKARSVLSQRYSGDITIFPEISLSHFPRVLSNPTTDFMIESILLGERATWPKLSRIKNHCAIELALDEAVRKLRARVAFSPSQVDLRMQSWTTPASSRTGRRRAKRGGKVSFRASTHFDEDKMSKSMLEQPQYHNDNSASDQRSRLEEPALISEAVTKISSSDATSSSHPADSSEEEDSASTSSSDTLPSPQPSLWPSTRQLFPSASQPATPSLASRSFASSPFLTMTRSIQPLTTTIPPTETPSTPELQYKRLFHPETEMHEKTTDNVNVDTSENTSTGSRSHAGLAMPLQLDISGTRGMLLRRKKSEVGSYGSSRWP